MNEIEMIREIRELADRFSEGWHEGVKIDASDVVLLSNTATALEQLAALKAERDELLAVLKKLSAWNRSYPSSRIYGYGDIKRIAAEMDAISAETNAAIAKAEARTA